MKYKCLVFDHDDTVVNSTATIHYPCFAEYLKEFRPGLSITLEDYFRKNFAPGFIEMCCEDFNMSESDLNEEVKYWNAYVQKHIPVAYPGIKEIMENHKSSGGYIAVISHSFKNNILRDYSANGLPKPDLIYGWEEPPEHRKPNVWPLKKVMEQLFLDPEDLLVIDDLKPGYDMAEKAHVDFAAVGWSNDIPEIEQFMRKNCKNYFKNVVALSEFLR